MRTIEEKIYKYDELSDEVKESLLEKKKEIDFEMYMEDLFHSDVQEWGRETLEDYFKNGEFKDVYYDFSYCQGSGSMIAFTINFEDINNKYHILNDEEMRYVKDKSIVNDVEIYHNDNLYYHEYTFDIKYYDNFGYWSYEDIKDEYNITEEEFDTIEDRIIKLLDSYGKHSTESAFVEDIIDMNKHLTRYVYNYLDNYQADEQWCLEGLREERYFENGELFCG
jgi:hypothetical protein